MTNPSDGACVRGCIQPDVHFADCSIYDENPPVLFPCKGCAPAPVVDGLVVCERCHRRIRGLLRNADDLLGRLWSLADQARAKVYSPVKVSSSGAGGSDQVAAELLDAITEISGNLYRWGAYIDMHTLRGLDVVLADADQALRLAAAVLDTHSEDETGARHWSLADAAAKWGIERRDRFSYQGPPVVEDELEEIVTPIPEPWYDPLLVSKDAALRAGVMERQLRKWVQAGHLAPVARLRDPRGVVTRWYRASDVDRVAKDMKTRRHSGGALKPD